jgi:hypothetical protein
VAEYNSEELIVRPDNAVASVVAEPSVAWVRSCLANFGFLAVPGVSALNAVPMPVPEPDVGIVLEPALSLLTGYLPTHHSQRHMLRGNPDAIRHHRTTHPTAQRRTPDADHPERTLNSDFKIRSRAMLIVTTNSDLKIPLSPNPTPAPDPHQPDLSGTPESSFACRFNINILPIHYSLFGLVLPYR